MSTRYLNNVLDDVLSRTDGIVAANFLTAEIDLGTLRDVAARVPLVDFFWNEPSAKLVDVAHEQGALVSWQVGSVEEAVAAVDAGVEVVIAQGMEAGGHVRSRLVVVTAGRRARRGRRARAGRWRDWASTLVGGRARRRRLGCPRGHGVHRLERVGRSSVVQAGRH